MTYWELPNPLPQLTRFETPNRTKQKRKTDRQKRIEWYNDEGDRASLARWLTSWLAGKDGSPEVNGLTLLYKRTSTVRVARVAKV